MTLFAARPGGITLPRKSQSLAFEGPDRLGQ